MSQEKIGYLVKRLSNRMSVVVDASLKKHDLTFSQIRVLDFIYEHGGEVNQKEIEEFLNVSHPTVVGLVGRLEHNGFIFSRVDEEDRRSKRVSLSRKALDLHQFIMKDGLDMEAQLSKGFSKEEISQLLDYLKRMNQNLES